MILQNLNQASIIGQIELASDRRSVRRWPRLNAHHVSIDKRNDQILAPMSMLPVYCAILCSGQLNWLVSARPFAGCLVSFHLVHDRMKTKHKFEQLQEERTGKKKELINISANNLLLTSLIRCNQ